MLCTKKASNRQCRKLRRLLAFLVVIVRSVVCDFPRDVGPGFCHFDHQRGCCDQKGQQRQQFRQCHPTFPLSRYTTSPGFDFKNKLAPRYNVPSMIFHETNVPPVRAAACVFDTAPYPPPFRRHFYCKKFAVPLVKRRIKSYIIFIVYLTECTSCSCTAGVFSSSDRFTG